MASEFPYQLVIFLDKIPIVGEPVYGGKNGWYAQIALKRRFRIYGIDEVRLIEKLREFFGNIPEISLKTGEVYKPESMPVHVIRVRNGQELFDLHNKIMEYLDGNMVSKFPDREGVAYLPHITAEYDSKWVIDVQDFIESKFDISEAWLLKDVEGNDSVAYKRFSLKN